MININQKKLENGLKVITSTITGTKAVTLLIFVGIGSRFETDKQAGISHFLEHMFFKGTKKRPTYKEIASQLDYLGGDFNAFTGNEYTGYYVQAAADKFPLALDILSDMFFNSTFPEEEMLKEKGVIIEEINMYEDQPTAKVGEELGKLVLGKTDLGRPIIGFKETVNAVTQSDLIKYHNNMYDPTNTAVIVAGAPLDFNWQEEIENVFGSWVSKKSEEFSKWNYKQTQPQLSLTHRQTDQAHFVLGFPTFPMKDKRRPIAKLLANILGGMMSARLFEEIREKRGLAYYVRAGLDDFHDSGIFAISAGVVVSKIEEAIKVTLDELERIMNEPVGDDELKKAKENIKGRVYLGLEDSQSVAQYIANQNLYFGEIKQPEETVEEIEKITSQQIKELAKEIFSQSRRNLAIIGPFKDKKIFEKLLT
jgi:predicted Zn-dependent peptidase